MCNLFKNKSFIFISIILFLIVIFFIHDLYLKSKIPDNKYAIYKNATDSVYNIRNWRYAIYKVGDNYDLYDRNKDVKVGCIEYSIYKYVDTIDKYINNTETNYFYGISKNNYYKISYSYD
ncbi:hypothetical protein KQI30_08270 [Clostridium bornimense]|uniref:hypothetical protein n=1 Tax=Clostridium bornimense TaxID=1216932 RepID=UPI001C0F5413|nr:hypothetical protein [Clostridium bornimense]MBU5316264.1 hypothetical protein [Clostridium bornimense]